jgi:peptidyl-prolyl cis-trans isomerase D
LEGERLTMMTKLREFTKVFIILVAVSFIGMMVFDWGMDITGRKSGRNQNIGEVNGEELSYDQFANMYRQTLETRRSKSDKAISEEDQRQIRNMVWEQFVQVVLLKDEIKRFKIEISDSEIIYNIKHYPLEQLTNNEAFQTNGQFDWNKYYAAFNNPEAGKFWLQVEEFYRQNLPYEKLQTIITSTARISDSEIEQEFIKNNLTARVSYIEILYSKFNDPDRTFSDDEIRNYYKEHISDYYQEEKRSLSYVFFSLKPSKEDTLRILNDFDEIKARIENGEDFNQLAMIYSEDPAKETNQGRYDFFERGTMVKPFEEACFNGKVGEIVGPVETPYGFHIIKIEDKHVKDGKEEVKVSHILLKVVAGPSSREKQETSAGFFIEDARALGFELVAERNDYKIEHLDKISENAQYIPGFGRNFDIPSFAFRSKTGDISNMIFTENGIVVLKLDRIIESGPRALDEVQNLVIIRLQQEEAIKSASQFANEIQNEIEKNIPFKTISINDESNKIKYDSTTSFSLNSYSVHDHIFRASAFSLDIGQISDIIKTKNGIYWQKLLEKTEFDSLAFRNQYDSIRYRLLIEKRRNIFETWYQCLKENAKIKDNRRKFYL